MDKNTNHPTGVLWTVKALHTSLSFSTERPFQELAALAQLAGSGLQAPLPGTGRMRLAVSEAWMRHLIQTGYCRSEDVWVPELGEAPFTPWGRSVRVGFPGRKTFCNRPMH